MITYIYLFLFLALLSFTDYIYIPKLSRIQLLYIGGSFVFLLLWAFASLRWKTGTDWESYYDTFYYFSEEYAVNFEPGFAAFVSFIRNITSNYTVFLTIFSFICISLKFYFFHRFNKEFFFTLIFLYYCYYFGDIFAVRQSLAISLSLFSTIFIINKKPFYFVLFICLATSIHTSSILYFFAYFIYWRKLSDKTFYYIIFFSILLGLIGFGGIILDLLFKALGLDGFMGDKFNNYLKGEDEVVNNPFLSYILGVSKRLLLIPLFIYVKNKTNERFIYFNGYFNLYMVGNIIYFLFAKDLAIFARASVPFLLFEIFLLGYVLLYFKRDKKKLVFIFFIMILFSWARFTALVNSYYDLYVPYNSIFDDKIERKLE